MWARINGFPYNSVILLSLEHLDYRSGCSCSLLVLSFSLSYFSALSILSLIPNGQEGSPTCLLTFNNVTVRNTVRDRQMLKVHKHSLHAFTVCSENRIVTVETPHTSFIIENCLSNDMQHDKGDEKKLDMTNIGGGK